MNQALRNFTEVFKKQIQGLITIKSISQWFYNHSYYNQRFTGELMFFNTGLVPVDNSVLSLDIPDWEMPQAQTYYEAIASFQRLCHQTLVPSTILEVGCGLGGGVYTLAHFFPDSKLYAIDLSKKAIQRSNRIAPACYTVADAHCLPFAENSFDFVITVECLHKLSIDLFITEIASVLRPGGVMCCIDFRATRFETLQARISHACAENGLQLAEMTNLTQRVLQSIDKNHARQQQVLNALPRCFQWLGHELLAMPGSQRHISYLQKQRCYYLCSIQKKN